MKRRIEFVKVMKKTTAVAMAATTAVGVVSASGQMVSLAAEKKDYSILDNKYMTRLKMDYSDKAILEIAFKPRDESGDVVFKEEMSKDLVEKGKIKIDDGKEYTFKEAGVEMERSPRGEYTASFKSENKDFIKTFYNKENFKITITTPEGYKIESKVPNTMSEEEKEKFKKSIGSESSSEDRETENSSEKENKESNEETPTETERETPSETEREAPSETEKEAPSENEKEKTPKTEKETPSENEKEKTPENKNTGETDKKADKGVFESAKVALLKSNHYDTTSMSGATIIEDAKILTDENGKNKLIMYFKPAVINGILAYATGFTLKDNSKTEFILKADNSGICVVDLPKFSEESKIMEGHIYSSIMDADVALKVSDIKNTSDNKSELDKKIEEAKKLLRENKYYEKSSSELKEIIKNAEKSSDYIDSYVALEKGIASLREKKDNPFVGDSLFHVNVIDTSVRVSKSIYKYARVEVNENKKPVITIKYSPYNDFGGKTYVKSIKVIGENGKEISSDYTVDSKNNSVLKFEMPYIPASGIFKVEMKVGDEEEVVSSDIKMDYTTIKKGLFRELMIDAIEKYNTYLQEDYSTKGNIEEKKNDFTEKTWERYSKALKKSQEDLKRIDLTQEDIDNNIEELKNARENLLYKIKAGKGNTANASTKGLNNPENYYNDGAGFSEHPLVVGWSGSKIKFGKNGAIYRVLNNGSVEEKEGRVKNTGKILIMAEDLRVKSKFAENESENIKDATRYDKSLMRAYLNGEFFNQNFKDIEKKAILESEISTRDAKESGLSVMSTGDEIKTRDKIFAPDLSIVTNSLYGYGSNDSRYTHDAYALRNIMQDSLGDISVVATKPLGRIGGYFVENSNKMQTAPTMYIDYDKIMMTLQVGADIPDSVQNVKKIEDNIWQLVLKDEDKKLNISNIEISKADVSVNYSGENIEGNTMVAVVVNGENLKNGTIKSIGKVGKLLKNGKLKFTVPEFNKKTDKLFVMAMDLNSENSISSSDSKEVDMSAREDNIKIENNNEKNSGKTNSKNISYEAPVKMMKYGEEGSTSMANGAIDKVVKVVERNGKSTVTMKFKPMKVQGLLGHLLKMKVEGKPVNVVKTDEKGNPVEISFEVEGKPEKIKSEVEVDIMNELAGGKSAPQNVNIVVDWNTKTNIVANEENNKGDKPVGPTGGNNSSKQGENSQNNKKEEKNSENTRVNTKKAKKYDVPVSMKKYGTDTDSMSANAVDKKATVIEKNGEKKVVMKFKALHLRGLEGHLIKMTVGGKPVKVISKDSLGRPVEIAFNVVGNPEKITAEVEVDVMNELAGGKSSPQKVDIKLDWSKKSNEKEIELSEANIKVGSNDEQVKEENKPLKYERIAGHDRYQTSVEISKKYFKTADNVVLASGRNYADALVSSSFAKSLNAPTLLTDKDITDSKVLEEILRLGTKKVTIVGGYSSVSEKVENALKTKGLTVERISGKNRYETSWKLAEKLMVPRKNIKVALVNGQKIADALSLSSLATKEDMPVIMVKNNEDNTFLKNNLKAMNIKDAVAIGGTGSISEQTLKSVGVEKTSRIAGRNRVETALEIAKRSYENPQSVFISDGDEMIDALSTGAVTYKAKAPIVLVQKNSMSDSVRKYVQSIKNIIAVGGEKTINLK